MGSDGRNIEVSTQQDNVICSVNMHSSLDFVKHHLFRSNNWIAYHMIDKE